MLLYAGEVNLVYREGKRKVLGRETSRGLRKWPEV